MPPHPERLPQEERELCERIVGEDLRHVKPALQRRGAELADAYGVRPQILVAMGEAAQVLSEIAEVGSEPSSLVVVGTRRLGASERMLLGSVSTKVLRTVRGSVLDCSRGRSKEAHRDELQIEV
jgi:nucleotide-binding universal stress UspA family protein